jgi:hypothetical protein
MHLHTSKPNQELLKDSKQNMKQKANQPNNQGENKANG